MNDFIRLFLDSSYAPHGYCLLWQPELVWTHVAADALIAAAYFSIPVALMTLIRQRADLRYSWIITLFAAFILACGCTHLMSIWTLWHGNYGAEAMVKVVTAIVSVATAIVLWPLIPKAVALPSAESLTAANADLATAIAARDLALAEMQAQIRHREQAEQALLQAQKLDALGQLTGGIAHDFNNLLQAITGNLELIEKRPDDIDRVGRWSRNARQAVDRGKKLTAQLLAFSRVQAMEITAFALAPAMIDTRDLIDRSLGLMVQLDMPPPADDLAVVADRNQLELALLNLAINARDAMPEGGTIAITAQAAKGQVHPKLPSGDYVMIEVTDQGVGMTPEVAARAMEPFFSTKGVGEGTGLGLSMVFGVVAQAKGVVEIDTAPGAGTTIRLFLRRAFDVAKRDDGGEGSAFADGVGMILLGRRVAVIDDDTDVLQSIVNMLAMHGATVFAEGDGASGLRTAADNECDLLVVDFAMPGMDGAEVAALSRAAYPARPILIATGFSESAKLDTIVGPGVGLLRKPFSSNALIAAIQGLLNPARD